MQHLLVCILLACCCCTPTAEEPDEEYERQEWMDYVPKEDIRRLKKNSEIQLSYMSNSQTEQLFQDDLIGCQASRDPQCPPPADAKTWKFNRVARKSQVVIEYFVEKNDETIAKSILTATEQIEGEIECLTFNQIYDPGPGAESARKNRVIAFVKGNRCAAEWGSQKSKLIIKVSDDCLDSDETGILLHLILHAFGFPKEHMRNDRDDHVRIYWENVIQHRKSEFKKDDDCETYADPYDYNSVMHPDYTFLSVSQGLPTITGNSKTKKAKIGRREKLSKYDIMKLNRTFCGEVRKTPCREKTRVDKSAGNSCSCPVIELKTCPQIVPSKEITTVKYERTTITETVTKTQKENTCVFPPVETHGEPCVKHSDTTSKPITTTTSPEPEPEDDTTTMRRPNILPIRTWEPSVEPDIAPTPRKRCREGLVTVTNVQTMIRTTTHTVYPYLTSKETTMRTVRKSFWYNPLDRNAPNDLLAEGTEWSQFAFAGSRTKVNTIRNDANRNVFSTHYEKLVLDDGAFVNQEKLETRILNC